MFSPVPDWLPEDCRSQIFEYLTLSDCLVMTQANQRSLLQALPEVRKRRQVQFLQPHSYYNQANTMSLPCLKLINPNHVSHIDKNTGSVNNGEDDKPSLILLPSAAERIEQLYRALPSSHPSNEDLRALVLDLQEEPSSNEMPQNFDTCLQLLHSYTRAHRLHASLLCQCTVHLKPQSTCRQVLWVGRQDHGSTSSLTTTLDQYLGDVLMVYYLMGHHVSGLIEGGPSPATRWIRDTLTVPMQDDPEGSQTAAHWYQLWVYLHARLLQRSIFTVDQCRSLGLEPNSVGYAEATKSKAGPLGDANTRRQDTMAQQDEHTGSLCATEIFPHTPFLLGSNLHNIQQEEIGLFASMPQRQQLLSNVATSFPNQTELFVHRTTMNQFGPLGPAFRGRDRVQSTTMSPSPFRDLLMETQNTLLATSDFSRVHRRWDADDPMYMWMVRLYRESSKRRPMTVMPPIVTIERML